MKGEEGKTELEGLNGRRGTLINQKKERGPLERFIVEKMEWFIKSIEGAVENGTLLVKVVESKIENLDASVKEMVGGLQEYEEEDGQPEIDYDNPQFAHLKITESLKKFVKQLIANPATFLQHAAAKSEDEQKLLWEEQRHAVQILEQVPEFSRFRYEMTPSQVKEAAFWNTYFSLIRQFHTGFEADDPASYLEAAHPSAEELHQQHSPKDSFPSQQSKNEKMSDVEEEYLKINKPYVGKLEEEDESYYSDFSILNPNSKKVLAV